MIADMIFFVSLFTLVALNYLFGYISFTTLRGDDDIAEEGYELLTIKILLLTSGMVPALTFSWALNYLKHTKYYQRNGYFIPTKKNKEKKLLRTLSE